MCLSRFGEEVVSALIVTTLHAKTFQLKSPRMDLSQRGLAWNEGKIGERRESTVRNGNQMYPRVSRSPSLFRLGLLASFSIWQGWNWVFLGEVVALSRVAWCDLQSCLLADIKIDVLGS